MASTTTVGERVEREPRLRRVLGLGVLLWLLLSMGAHTIAWLLLLGAGGGGFGEGGGDYGALGEGGLVEFAVAGPVQDEPFRDGADEELPGPVEPEMVPDSEPEPVVVPPPRTPDPEMDPESEPETLDVEADGAQAVASAALEENAEMAESAGQVSPEAEAESGQAPTEPSSGAEAASGTGSSFDDLGRPAGERGIGDLILRSAGHIPGSIAQQRSLLPRAAHCDDPVVGVWRAHKYSPLYRDWAHFTLRVHRVEGDRLRGTITTRLWNGTRFDSSPPPCAPGTYHYTVRMQASGMARGRSITFGSRSYRVVRATCPRPFGFSYNPDRFSGDIDPGRQEFQSVNNDGGRDINAPYLFRRIACDPDG